MSRSAGPGPAVLDRPAWRTAAMPPRERRGRVAAGLAAVAVGIILLADAGPALAVVSGALLAAAGLGLMATGALGRCPLSARLGYHSRSPRKAR